MQHIARPPAAPKPSISTTGAQIDANAVMPPRASARDVQFQPYNASHPPLLEEIEMMVQSQLARINKDKENKPNENAPPASLFRNGNTDAEDDSFQSDKLAGTSLYQSIGRRETYMCCFKWLLHLSQ